MAEFDDKINSILSNPALMSQIMAMANSLGQNNPPAQQPSQPAQQSPPPSPAQSNPLPFDPGTMQSMMELLRGTQIDQRQQNLLKALGAYLPNDRVHRLQKAMQAAKIARYASTALNHQQNR